MVDGLARSMGDNDEGLKSALSVSRKVVDRKHQFPGGGVGHLVCVAGGVVDIEPRLEDPSCDELPGAAPYCLQEDLGPAATDVTVDDG